MNLSDKQFRKSHIEFDQVYFWTDTVKDWKHIFLKEKYKEIILSSLGELTRRGMIDVFGFVIMPNHLHIIWEMKEPNGKELPHASFNKFTSHMILKDMKANHPEMMSKFKVEDPERKYRIWQRDPMAIILRSKRMMEQVLKYIHMNPLQEHWNLVDSPEKYRWSSAGFYETGVDEFGFLKHYLDRF